MNAIDIRTWLVGRLADLRQVAPHQIDTRSSFHRQGVDSLTATRLVADLSAFLGRPLPRTIVWQYTTIDSLVRFLVEGETVSRNHGTSLHTAGVLDEPIATVGMACRFPGAHDIDSFWKLLTEGRDAITEVPKARWDTDAFYDENADAPGKMRTKWGGFIDDVDLFDPLFFGISPREAAQMDPQQRIMLELAWEALEDAGIAPMSLVDSSTGVFVGAMWQDYTKLPADPLTAITQHTATAQDLSIIPARISYTLGLRGPSIAVNTACSSSLVAVHYARRSLQLGECDMAVVGGVNLILSPMSTVAMSKFGAMAPDGRSKAFDARANGYVRGEGAGIVIMKRLSRALADGDPIHCILRGSAINNDGASNGLTAPSPRAQALVLEQAYRDAGVEPHEVQFVETHGTGTLLGDPIEAGALGAVLGVNRAAEQPLVLGSVKTNIGHLEAAAGIAGFIKAALSLERGIIPPNLHFQSGNPHIAFDTLHLRVPTQCEPWPRTEGPALAGVSSFGFGGTNCHVVLEASPPTSSLPKHARASMREAENQQSSSRPVFVFGGQGSQWLRMGVELLREPAFHASMVRCSDAMREHLDRDLLQVLMGRETAWLEETALIQPAIFAIQVSLGALFRARGIEPVAVVGQSMGEVAAAYVAGCLRLSDAVRIICARSRIVRQAAGKGSMAVIELSISETQKALEACSDRLSIAVSTSPYSTVIAGDTANVETFVAELTNRGVDARHIKVDYASHCAQMDSLLPELSVALAGIEPRRGTIPFHSSVDGKKVDGRSLDAAYWCRNLRQPVLLADTICQFVREGQTAFLELDPHPVLVRAIEDCLRYEEKSGVVVCPMHRDEPPREQLTRAFSVLASSAVGSEADNRPTLVVLSAHDEKALRDRAGDLAQWLAEHNEVDLADVAYTAGVRRSHFDYRLGVVGATKEAVGAALRSYSAGEKAPDLITGKVSATPAKIVFVFPGQGSQWVGMGRQLYREEQVFRDVLAACDQAIRKEADFSVVDELNRSEESSRLSDIGIVQPVLFAIEVALAALWRSWGVEPVAVVGHSMGEVAAAYVAGGLSLEDAAAVICRRSRLLRTISGQGAMALVELSLANAEKSLVGYEDRLSVAVSNGPRTTVIAGDPSALTEVIEKLEKKGVFVRRVKVDVASHNPRVDPLRPDLLAALAHITPLEPRIPMRSTVTGEWVRPDEFSGGYWADNLRKPVLFSHVIEQCIADGHTYFVEMSPHPILMPAVEENLKMANAKGAALASLRRGQDERHNLLASLGALYTHGCPVAWKRLFPNGGRVVELPTYPWHKERHWHEAPNSPLSGSRPGISFVQNKPDHPLLGWPFAPSAHTDALFWQQTLSKATVAYLAEHRVHDRVVFPGSAYVEMAVAAGAAFGSSPHFIEDLAFEQSMPFDDETPRDVQIALLPDDIRTSFQISSRDKGGTEWLKHARGFLRSANGFQVQKLAPVASIASRFEDSLNVGIYYEKIRARQIEHGPSFQGITELRVRENEVFARIRLPNDVGDDAYHVHPAWLDACFQVFFALLDNGPDTYVPVHIDRLLVHARPTREAWVLGSKHSTADSSGESIRCDLRVIDEVGNVFVSVDGLSARRIGRKTTASDSLASCVYEVAWRPMPHLQGPRLTKGGDWLVFAEGGGLAQALAERLSSLGHRCIRVLSTSSYQRMGSDRIGIDPRNPDDYRRLFDDIFGTECQCRGIVHLSGLDATPFEQTTAQSLSRELSLASVSATYLLQAVVRHGFHDVPRLFLVTRGAQTVHSNDPVSVAQAPLLALGKTMAMEHPELACTRIDLSPIANPNDADRLLQELGAVGREDQIAWRGDERYVARLERGKFENDEVPDRKDLGKPQDVASFRLEIRQPGVLDNLSIFAMETPHPGPGEVLIEVAAAGLNFLDVLLALGALPDDVPGASTNGPRLGGECTGTVLAVGEGVLEFAPGEEIIALGASAFGSHMVARAALCVRKPSNMVAEEAATLPIVMLTAYYALEYVARLRAGERILIHAGAGGVGLAAIQWAQHVGAEIFATAGSDEKRHHLRRLGVQHVLDSRSLAFAEEVKRATNGEGIDVVLNSLSGDFIPASLELLRDHGRFLEIGKRDYYENKRIGLRPFLRNLSFSLVDLRSMMLHRPDFCGQLLREVMDRIANGALKPLPVRPFPVSHAIDAFHYMAQAKHIGKIALTMRHSDIRIVPMSKTKSISVRPDRSYLITGGLGGLGLSVANWFVEQGARSLVLVGRKGPSDKAMAAIESMERTGAQVHCVQVDVSQENEVRQLFVRMKREMPALGGIVHAAAVLEDHTLLEQSEESFHRVLAPKALGAWNLHVNSLETPIDLFLMYSSAAALTGSPGQANYCAANAFLDALACERVRLGLPGMSIQWGPFTEVGLAAATDIRGKRMSLRGMDGISPAEGLEALQKLLRSPRPEVGFVRLDAQKWVEFFPMGSTPSFFSELVIESDSVDEQSMPESEVFLQILAEAGPEERHVIFKNFLVRHVGHVLRLSPEQIDTTRSLPTLGMDSLMLLELRNRIEPTLGITLSTTVFLQDGGLHQISTHLLERALRPSLARVLASANMDSRATEDEVSFTI